MRPLLPMSCLTLINEGADTGGISESRGDAEARGHPRRRAGAGREKATATPPRPVGKGKGEARARSRRRTGAPEDGHREGRRSPASAGTWLGALAVPPTRPPRPAPAPGARSTPSSWAAPECHSSGVAAAPPVLDKTDAVSLKVWRSPASPEGASCLTTPRPVPSTLYDGTIFRDAAERLGMSLQLQLNPGPGTQD